MKANKFLPSYLFFMGLAALLTIAATFGLVATALHQKPRPETNGSQAFTLTIQGRERNYLAYTPKDTASAQSRIPAVIVLHGGGGPMGSAQMMMEVSGWTQKAEEENFLAVFPNGTPRDPAKAVELRGNIQEWSDGSGRSYAEQIGVDDVAFIDALIDDLLVKFYVDEQRIFVTGFSNGASMTFRIGVELSDRIAAIAPVADVLSIPPSATNSPVPLLYISGSGDKRPTTLSDEHPLAMWVHTALANAASSENPVVIWAQTLGCPEKPEIGLKDTGIQTTIYAHCRDDSEVIAYTVQGMGHVYPGAQTELWENGADNPANDILNATDAIWDFFKRHKKISVRPSARNAGCQILTEQNEKIQCWEEALSAELNERGLEAAFVLFKKLHVADQDFASECHGFTHLLGTEAYRLFQNNEDFSVPAIVSFCNYGFYHGFMEALLTTGGNMKEARAFCGYIDKELAAESPESPEQCYHGIGHGTAGVHDERLWGDADTIVAQGLELCERVSDTEDRRYRCASGVYNAISDFHMMGEFGFSMDMIDPKDPLGLCLEQPKKYQEPCYGNMKSIVSVVTGKDFKKVASVVEGIPDARNAEAAIWYLAGYNMQTKLYLNDYSEDVAVCRSIASNLYIPCIRGLATGFLWYATPEQEYEGALDFCALDILLPEETRVCFLEIIPRLSFYYSYEKVMEICETDLVPTEWKKTCRTKQLKPAL